MPRSTIVRRALAVTASTGLAAGLAWLPAGPASAIVPPDSLELQGNVNFSTSGPACSEVGTEPSQTTNYTNGHVSSSVSMDTTVTNTDGTTPDPADHTHVTGTISATGTVKKHNGSMTSATLTGSGHVSVVRAEGNASQCNVTADMSAVSQITFSEAKSGWVYVTRSQGKTVLTEMVIQGTSNTGFFELFSGAKSTRTDRVFLKPGDYQAASAFVVSNRSLILLRAAQTTTLSSVFHAAGSALKATAGSGKAFVKFPGSVSCSHHTATLTWTAKAGHVKSGAFFVNGVKKASDGTPRAGEKIVLHRLSPTADAKITAKLALKGGGSAIASRAYVPCKG